MTRLGCLLWLACIGCPAVTAECAAAYANCLNSTCCANGNFGCYKREGVQFAMCKPVPETGCADQDGWQCPGWENCDGKYEACTASKCCSDPNFGCFKRPTRSYAQCRPKSPDGACTDTADWRCPGWELCTGRYEACQSTNCCSDATFTCYRKHGAYAQCMPTGSCTPGTDGECTEASVRKPPARMPVLLCASPCLGQIAPNQVPHLWLRTGSARTVHCSLPGLPFERLLPAWGGPLFPQECKLWPMQATLRSKVRRHLGLAVQEAPAAERSPQAAMRRLGVP